METLHPWSFKEVPQEKLKPVGYTVDRMLCHPHHLFLVTPIVKYRGRQFKLQATSSSMDVISDYQDAFDNFDNMGKYWFIVPEYSEAFPLVKGGRPAIFVEVWEDELTYAMFFPTLKAALRASERLRDESVASARMYSRANPPDELQTTIKDLTDMWKRMKGDA